MIWKGFLHDKKLNERASSKKKDDPASTIPQLQTRFFCCGSVRILNTLAGNLWYPAQKYKTPCSCDHPCMNKKCGLEPSALARPSCLVPFCSLASLHLGRCLVEVDFFVCCIGFVACRMVVRLMEEVLHHLGGKKPCNNEICTISTG